jgi:hypothetical protein
MIQREENFKINFLYLLQIHFGLQQIFSHDFQSKDDLLMLSETNTKLKMVIRPK